MMLPATAGRQLPIEMTRTPLEVALERCRVASTSPTAETHAVLLEMVRLSKGLVAHVEAVMAGRSHDWDAIGDQSAVVTRLCRRARLAELGLDDVGDSGGR